jgi:acyl carrier protein
MNNQIDIDKIIRNKVYEILKIKKNASIDNIAIGDLNLDSLDFFELIIDLEENHKIFIPIDNISNKLTLSELIRSAEIKQKIE